jgi:hypothetical protein
MEWVRFNQARERFDAMLAATWREYNLWMQASDLGWRLNGARPVRHCTQLDRQLAFSEAVGRRIARRRDAWDRAKHQFYWGEGVPYHVG